MSKTKIRPRSNRAFEEGSGNVFADLGLTDADELFARAKLGFHVYKLLEDKEAQAAGNRRLCSASSSRRCPT